MSADQEAVEVVSEILARACAGGVSIEAPFELLEEGLGARLDPARPAVVRGYLPARDARAARAAVLRVERELGHLQAFGLRPIGELRTRLVHESDWAEAWQSHFPVLRVGRRIVIQPTWREHSPRPGDVVIRLDPGMAFGTGLHPTTRLCLAGLEELAEAGLVGGRKVLDVGCGSGILGICAALLGARLVLGLDTDPLAVEVTRRNVRLNGLQGVVSARRGSIPLSEPATYELVLANLVAGLLIELAQPLTAALQPGAILVASGIFADRQDEVISAFAAVGLELVETLAEGDWRALQLAKRRV